MKTRNAPVVSSTFAPTVGRWAGVLFMASLLTMASYGKSLTWTGGGNNSYWSSSANWGGAGTPANGDSLTFPSGTARLMNTNDLSNLSLANLRFAAGATNYGLYGNAIALSGGLSAAYTGGQSTVGMAAITLTASQSVDCTATGASLYIKSTITNGTFTMTNNVGGLVSLSGNVYGTSGGVVKTGTGTLTYAGPNDNTYAGTTYVNAGTLTLNVSGYNAFLGLLVIGDGSGAGSPIVRLLQSSELPGTSITVNTGGLLDLNGYSDTVGNSLALNGTAGVQTGTGALTLSSNATITVGTGNPSISGNLNVGSGACGIIANGTLTISANVSGSADLIKSGIQSVYLSGNSTYTGLTVVQQGYVYVQNALALGATNAGTVVSNGATLVLSGSIGITNETLTLNGPGVSSYWGFW